MRAIRVATICHSEDDVRQPHRRVRLELARAQQGYEWVSPEGETGVGGNTVADACEAARVVWGAPDWGLRADWL